MTFHAAVRWLERAGGFAKEVQAARKAVGAREGCSASKAPDHLVLAELGFDLSQIEEQVVDERVMAAIRMGAETIKIDGVCFAIGRGKLVTVVTNRFNNHEKHQKGTGKVRKSLDNVRVSDPHGNKMKMSRMRGRGKKKALRRN